MSTRPSAKEPASLKIETHREFDEWVERLRDEHGRRAIFVLLRRIQSAGTIVGDWNPVGSGLYELRIHKGPGYRVYYFFQGKRVIVVAAGGDESSQPRDIQRARNIFAEVTGK